MFCVVNIEVPQLVEEAARGAEEEEGGLDVEHGVQVLQQQLLLVLHVAGGELVDRLVVGLEHNDCKMFWFPTWANQVSFLIANVYPQNTSW